METICGDICILTIKHGGSDTKYRDIADGNAYLYLDGEVVLESDTKYRDIADGNIHLPLYSPQVFQPSDTKYRDIADGNSMPQVFHHQKFPVRYQVPRYSGWKLVKDKR